MFIYVGLVHTSHIEVVPKSSRCPFILGFMYVCDQDGFLCTYDLYVFPSHIVKLAHSSSLNKYWALEIHIVIFISIFLTVAYAWLSYSSYVECSDAYHLYFFVLLQ